MKNFIKQIFTVTIAVFIAFGVMLFVLLVSVAALLSTQATSSVEIESKSILSLKIPKNIKDYNGSFIIDKINYAYEDHSGLNDIIEAIKVAKTDDNIKGIAIPSATEMDAGISQIKALRRALEDFKTSKKFVYAYGDMISQKEYYLKSVADSVFINPVGVLEFKGLVSEVMFFKSFTNKLGVRMEVIRHGKYKSAVEPFLNDTMSEESRHQVQSLLNSIWQTMVTDVSKSRNIPIETLNKIAENLDTRSSKLAVQNRLADAAWYRDEYESFLKKKCDIQTDEDLSFVDILDYAEHVSEKKKSKEHVEEHKIAVIYAQGTIIYGKGNNKSIGQDLMIESLREAVKDKSIKGIVLRINSPGGSALASELIWREIEVSKKKKPIYVSMGDVAASGGYYIACNSDRIFAEEATVTGSIGVFGLLPIVKDLANKYGINVSHVKTHKNSLIYSPLENLSEDSKAAITENVEDIYKTFLERVSFGRKKTITEIDAIAQGRVWSGSQALDNGLVDEIGSLDMAVSALAKHLKIENKYKVTNFPQYTVDIGDMLGGIVGKYTQNDIAKTELVTYLQALIQDLESIDTQHGLQARMQLHIDIK